MGRMESLYFEDDNFTVSDEVKSMSHEERMRMIRLFEEEGRKEAENIPDTKPLLADR